MLYTIAYYVAKNNELPQRLTYNLTAETPDKAREIFYYIICNPQDTAKWQVEFDKKDVILVDKKNKVRHTFSDVSVKEAKCTE